MPNYGPWDGEPVSVWFDVALWPAGLGENCMPSYVGYIKAATAFQANEIRYRRPALREMKQVGREVKNGEEQEDVLFHGIEDAFLLETYIAGLWGYAVGHVDGGADGLPDGWLRYVIPSETDVNRSRWEVHPDWQVIQSAFAVPELAEMIDLLFGGEEA